LFVGLSNVNANDELITAEWLDTQQTTLKTAQAELPAEKKALDDKITDLKIVTDKMLQAAVEKWQAANQKVETLHLELKKAKTQLEKQQDEISTLTTKLDELTQYPLAELTIAQNQTIDETQKQLAKLQQAIKLETRHIKILKEQKELAAEKTALALKWQIQLQTAFFKSIIEKREEMIAAAKTSIERQKEALEIAETQQPNKIAQLKSVETTVKELTKQLKKVSLDKDAAEIELSNLSLENKNATAILEKKRQNSQKLQDNLETLRKATEEKTAIQEQNIVKLENKIKQNKQLFALNEQELDILSQREELAKKQLALITSLHNKLQLMLSERKNLNLQAYMEIQQQRHLSQSANLRGKLNQLPLSEDTAVERELLKIQIHEANEQAQQVERQVNAQAIEEQLMQLQAEPAPEETPQFSKEKLKTLQAAIGSVDVLLNELNAMQALLHSKIAILDKQQNVLSKRDDDLSGNALASNKQAQKILVKIKASLQQELNKISTLQAKGQKTLLRVEENYKNYSRLALWRMRELPTNQTELQALVKDVSQVQFSLQQGFQLIQNGIKQAVQKISMRQWYQIGIILLIWILFIVWLVIFLGQRIKAAVKENLFGSHLVRMNAFGIAIIGIVALLLWQIKPNNLIITVTFIFLFAWLASKMLINLLYLLLSKVDVKLYKKLRWRIVFLALVSVFVALVHIEPEGEMLALSVSALDTIDIVFMLLLFLMVFPLFRWRKVMLSNMFKGIAGYWRLLISLISLLLPFAIVAISVLALLGYVTMGLVVVKQLSVVLLVLAAWLIAQGFLAIVTDLLKDSRNKDSRFYDMWTRDLVPSFSKFIGLILLGLAVIAVIWLNGWYSEIGIKGDLQQIFGSPLFMLGGKSITIGYLLVCLVLLWIVFWLVNWLRILTYRSIYLNITDNGVQIDKLRTNLTIGISHSDDLHVAEKLIMDVLEEIPETLPRYDVWLSEFTNSSVNLTIRYFVNYKQNHPQEIQSKVLFMILDRFKKEGIAMPFSQQDNIKPMTEDNLLDLEEGLQENPQEEVVS
jgi:hypothetical protein